MILELSLARRSVILSHISQHQERLIMPNFNNNGVRRRYWKRWVKAQEIGDPAQRTMREMRRNYAFAVHMLRGTHRGRLTIFWMRVKRLYARIRNWINGKKTQRQTS
jgi:hypothetical protein